MTGQERTTVLPPLLSSATLGRHFACDVVRAWGLPELVDDVALCTSELVANAVLHAGTELTLQLRQDAAHVRVEVSDGVVGLAHVPGPQLDHSADHGRGLQIVEALSAEWGVTERVGGKSVWFTLPIPDAGHRGADVVSLGEFRADHAVEAAPRRRWEAEARSTQRVVS